MTLGEQMVEYRARSNLSMRDAAKKANISLQAWMYVERGLQNPQRLTEAKIKRLIEEEEQHAENQS